MFFRFTFLFCILGVSAEAKDTTQLLRLKKEISVQKTMLSGYEHMNRIFLNSSFRPELYNIDVLIEVFSNTETSLNAFIQTPNPENGVLAWKGIGLSILIMNEMKKECLLALEEPNPKKKFLISHDDILFFLEYRLRPSVHAFTLLLMNAIETLNPAYVKSHEREIIAAKNALMKGKIITYPDLKLFTGLKGSQENLQIDSTDFNFFSPPLNEGIHHAQASLVLFSLLAYQPDENEALHLPSHFSHLLQAFIQNTDSKKLKALAAITLEHYEPLPLETVDELVFLQNSPFSFLISLAKNAIFDRFQHKKTDLDLYLKEASPQKKLAFQLQYGCSLIYHE